MTALSAYLHENCSASDARETSRRILRGQERYSNCPPVVISEGGAALGLAPYLTDGRSLRQSPLIGGDGRYLLSADISIFDRESVARRLNLSVAHLRGLSDAELFLAAWERFDEDCLSWLNADFAFALWDSEHQELVLSRDYTGQRPLFYHRAKDWLAVASMPAGLFALRDVAITPNRRTLAHYAAIGQPQGPEWFFEGISRVLPGQILRLSLSGTRSSSHWPPERRELVLPNAAAYAASTTEAFDKAVAARIGTSKAVGCQLSSGLDSGAVMASAAQLIPEGARLTALTAAPPMDFNAPSLPGRIFDEAPYAAAAAAEYPNVDHLIIQSESSDVTHTWDNAFWLFQAPLPNPCNFLWFNALNDAARARGVRKMLSGSLGNITLSFHPRNYYANLLTSGRFRTLLRELSQARRQGQSKMRLVKTLLHPLLPERILKSVQRLRGRAVDADGSHFGWDKTKGVADSAVLGRGERDNWIARVSAISHLDFGVYMKGLLAGWGIEQADPTADRHLFELCLSIPDHVYVNQGRTRALARMVLEGRLPRSIVNGTHRGYQGADWRRSVLAGRQSLMTEIERVRRLPMVGETLDLDGIQRALQEMSDSSDPGQTDDVLIRRGVLRGMAAAHFIRKSSGTNY